MAFVDACVGTSCDCARQELIRIILADYHNLTRQAALPEFPSNFQAIRAGHADVEQDYIGSKFPHISYRFKAIRRLAAYRPIGFCR